MMPGWFYALGDVITWLFMLAMTGFVTYVLIWAERERRRPRRTRDAR